MAELLQYEECVVKLAHCLSSEDKQWVLNIFQLPQQYKRTSSVSMFKALEMIGMYSRERPEGLAVLPRWLQNKSLERKIRKKMKVKRSDSFRPTPNEELYASADLHQCFLVLEGQALALNAHLELVKKIIQTKNKTSDAGLERAGGVSQLEKASRSVDAMLDCMKEARKDHDQAYSSFLVKRPLPQPPPGSAPPIRRHFPDQSRPNEPEDVYDDFILPPQGVSQVSHEAQMPRSHSFDISDEYSDVLDNSPVQASQRNFPHRGVGDSVGMQAHRMQARGMPPTSPASPHLLRRPLPSPSTKGDWHDQEGGSPSRNFHHQPSDYSSPQKTDPAVVFDEPDDVYYNTALLRKPPLPAKPYAQKGLADYSPHKSSSTSPSPLQHQQEFFGGSPRNIGRPTPPSSSVQRTTGAYSGGSVVRQPSFGREDVPRSPLSDSPLFNKQRRQMNEDRRPVIETDRGSGGGTHLGGAAKPKAPILPPSARQ